MNRLRRADGSAALALALVLCGAMAWARTATAQAASAGDLTGSWQGTVEAGGPPGNQGGRIVLKVLNEGGGAHPVWKGMAYTIDDKTYGYEGRPTTEMSFAGGAVRFAIGPIGVTYEGKLSTDGKTIVGHWTQGGQAHPLDLVRADGDAAWAIPEESKAMAKDADPDWEVVTVKPADPNGMNSGFQFHGRDVEVERKPVEFMLLIGFGLHKDQIVNLPDWARSEVWDAKGFADVPGQPSAKQFQGMIRKLLVERFGRNTTWNSASSQCMS
ncbi:MAG TPA: DUF3738 domain-containing protein [Acidobacteriaceae bacterium]|nr:DUF3738 domain-containing protein [Acidobacteriaceae bacterium]